MASLCGRSAQTVLEVSAEVSSGITQFL